jgi:hypothetical protein
MEDRCDVRRTTLDRRRRVPVHRPKMDTAATADTSQINNGDNHRTRQHAFPCNERGGLLLTRRSVPGCFYLCWQQMRLIKSIYISMCVRLEEGNLQQSDRAEMNNPQPDDERHLVHSLVLQPTVSLLQLITGPLSVVSLFFFQIFSHILFGSVDP